MAFDLMDALKGVSSLDTGREQITYIPREKIRSDAKNFYALSDIPALAENIALCGLQQPIRLRPDPDAEGMYIIVSGHRRKAAVDLLAEEEPERWTEIPCVIERDAVSPALQQLRLIYANAGTRRMSSAELSEQAEQTEALLYQLKAEGYEFPGRMREHVAKAVGASESKIARLKVIRDNLAEEWRPAYQDGSLTETAAYAMAALSLPRQRLIFEGLDGKVLTERSVRSYNTAFDKIEAIQCQQSQMPCTHAHAMELVSVRKKYYWEACETCCMECLELINCKTACASAQPMRDAMRATRKEERKLEKSVKQTEDDNKLALTKTTHQRVREAMEAKGVSVEAIAELSGLMTSTVERLQGGEVSTNSPTAFGFNLPAKNLASIIAMADLLDVSVDYLLGRPVRAADAPRSASPWRPAEELPKKAGSYVCIVRVRHRSNVNPISMDFDGEDWFYLSCPLADCNMDFLQWTEFPECGSGV